MSDPYCSFTVNAQRCCPTIIAVAHTLYFHRHKVDDNCLCLDMEELALKMADLNAAYAAMLDARNVKLTIQNATSGAALAESLSEPDTKA